MIITAYHRNYRKYAVVTVNSKQEAEKTLDRLYYRYGLRYKSGRPLFRIDDSKMLTLNEARALMGYPVDKYALDSGN